jgi:two-component system cell cycle sensor histidine kinase/response regulator CckA
VETLPGRMLDCNTAACHMFGYSGEELAELSVADLVAEHTTMTIAASPSEELTLAAADLISENGVLSLPPVLLDRLTTGSVSVEMFGKRADGQVFPVEASARIVTLGGEQLLIVYARDITARRQVEEALRESEDRYRDLVEHSQDLICIHDLEGRALSVNPTAARLLGYDQDELLQMNIRDILAPEVRDGFDSYLAAVRQDGAASGLMLVETRTGERRIWQYKTSLRTEGVAAPLVRATAQDVTERIQAQQALKELKEFNEGIVQSMAEGIAVQDAEGCFSYVNPAAANLLGYTAGELVGQHWTGIVPPAQQAIVQAADERRWRGIADHYEVELQRKDGTRLPVRISGSPLFREDEIDGTLAVFSDVSERVRADQERQQRTAQLEALRDVGLELVAQLNLEDLLRSIVSRAVELVGGTGGGLYLYQPERDTIEWVMSVAGSPVAIGSTLRRGEGLCGRIWESGEPLVVDDYPRWEGRAAGFESYPWKSVVGAPICSADEFLGVVVVEGEASGAFSRADAEVLSLFATQAAIAFENARLFEAERAARERAEEQAAELRARGRYLMLLNDITRAALETPDLETMVQALADRLGELLGADACYITSWDEARQMAVPAAAFGTMRDVYATLRVQLGEATMTESALRGGQPIVAGDVFSTPYLSPRIAAMFPARSLLALPLIAGDQKLGAALIAFDEPHEFTVDEISRGRQAADHVALALAKAQLVQAEREQRQLAETLREVAGVINTSLDREQVLSLILEQVARVVDYDNASVMLLSGDTLEIVAQRGFRLQDRELGRIRVDRFAHLQQAVRTRRPGIIPETTAVPRWQQREVSRYIHCWLGVPLVAQDRVIGLLNLGKEEAGYYTQRDADLVMAFAAQAAIAIENARLHSVTQKRLQEQIALRRAGAAISSAMDMETIWTRIAEQMGQAIDATSAHVSSYEPSTMMTAVLAEYLGPDARPAERVSDRGVAYPENGDAAWLQTMQAGQHDISHLGDTDLTAFEQAHMQQYGARTILYIPLRVKDRLIGYVELWESRRRREYTSEEIALCQDIAQQAAIALENVRLYEQAHQEIRVRRRAEEEIQQRNRELALLNRVIAASAASQQPEPILEAVCRELALAFDVPQSAAALFNEEKTEAVVVAEYRAEGRPPSLGEIIPATGNPSSQYLLEHKAPFVADDAQTDPRLAPIHELMRRRGTVSLLVLPLLVEGEVVGSLGVDAIELRPFSVDEVHLAWRVAEQVSGALARVRLEETQRRLSAAVEQAAEGVIITDPDGTVLYVNPAFERITGYDHAQAIGFGPRLPEGDGQATGPYRKMWQTITSEPPWQGRFTDRRPDGSPYSVDSTVTPVRNPAGEIVNYVATMRDVTRELQLEEQFRQAQKMEALGRLAGGIAHDFNNLLTVIQVSTHLLQRQLRPEDPLWEHVQRIQDTGAGATKLTKQLLSFSRREVIEPHVLSLNEVVGELSRMLKRIIGEDIELNTALADDLWPVRADRSQLDQVILNLVVNARDAMPEGGALTIGTANVLLDEAYVASHVGARPGEHVRLTIRDTGVGMDDQVMDHLFEPFFTTKAWGQGTGLGLPTVFGIVKQNQGHIEVDSQAGQGTTLKIYLPRAPELASLRTAPSGARPPATADQLLGTETILVVEDEADVLSLTVELLESCGYQVLAARNGLEALQTSQRYDGPIHLLLTDVVMPLMNGKELADRLQSQRPETYVLFMSGYADDAIAQRGAMAPGTAFLPKPLTIDKLTQTVRAVLDGQP